ncbi:MULTISPECIES: thermonuclease family protein [Bradyrhizobium]|uniref:Thermonuclease family protein n=1 Tax=Bradyrhizobium brasilense TaxID=1419277 RepID=A0ABY8JAE6_9BRAD|nr:thermonuclease family protein [Bradyrhizobium brasilense]MCP3419275.1 thermonuclease family protein [Bradyrhizobium brasilense]WFU62387.1 thermonuclease family protein [Bradyrhizobium brasilense]
MKRRAMIAAFLAVISSPACAAKLSGPPRIVDGNTIEIEQTKIRLSGIDAPETDQICLDTHGQKWACGIAARDELIKHSNGQTWDCHTTGRDEYGRSLGSCFIAGEDVNAWMVRSGWALSWGRNIHIYAVYEVVASHAYAGLWSGAFITPWDWRHRNKGTIIIGASSVPTDAQELLLGSALLSDPPSPECLIKGTVGGNGERIYHVPGQFGYGQIDMTKKRGERWLCSEAEAEATGWRKAAR